MTVAVGETSLLCRTKGACSGVEISISKAPSIWSFRFREKKIPGTSTHTKESCKNLVSSGQIMTICLLPACLIGHFLHPFVIVAPARRVLKTQLTSSILVPRGSAGWRKWMSLRVPLSAVRLLVGGGPTGNHVGSRSNLVSTAQHPPHAGEASLTRRPM